MRIAADAADQVAEFVANDDAAERLVRQAVARQIMLVEEMAERAMANVVQQAGQSHQRFDISAAGHVGANFLQAVIQPRDGPARQMHDAHHMLKPRMLGGGKDPPGGLQLMNLPHPLDPRMIDDLPLGRLARRQSAAGDERDVAVDRIEAQAFTAEIGHGISSLRVLLNFADYQIALVALLAFSPAGVVFALSIAMQSNHLPTVA